MVERKHDGPGITSHYARSSVDGSRLDREEVGRFATLASKIRLSGPEFREMARLYRKSGVFMAHTGYGISFDDYLARAGRGGPVTPLAAPRARSAKVAQGSRADRGRGRTRKGASVSARVDIRDDHGVLAPAGTRGVVTRAPTRAEPTVGVRFENGRSLWVRPSELQASVASREGRRARVVAAKRSERKRRAQKAVARKRWTFGDGT